jgi:uncharacterized SAM-binding protein YcdF (DUF218 family)
MLRKHYIFESNATRYRRLLRNSLLLIILSFLLYSIVCVLFILLSSNESQHSERSLFNRPPDLVVVFTGDQGRIPFALRKAREYKQSQIFITGVHSRNSVQTLLNPLQLDESFDPNFLEIDYLARNTVENVLATLRYMRENRSLNRALIVSHDYHIMRIRLIVNKLNSPNDQFEFFYQGVPTNYLEKRNLKILYKEVYKLIRTYLFLMLWDVDTPAITHE